MNFDGPAGRRVDVVAMSSFEAFLQKVGVVDDVDAPAGVVRRGCRNDQAAQQTLGDAPLRGCVVLLVHLGRKPARPPERLGWQHRLTTTDRDPTVRGSPDPHHISGLDGSEATGAQISD
jgi:hypothetical protein